MDSHAIPAVSVEVGWGVNFMTYIDHSVGVKKYRFLDLSGYVFTGKHAVIDLMREFKGYRVPRFDFEFNLVRIQGGIRDLETALVDDWSPVRSDAAIRHFKKLIKRFSERNRILSPRTWFSAVGWDYDGFYGNQFSRLSEEYINNLVAISWKVGWPYPLAEISSFELFLRKIKCKILRMQDAYDFEIYLTTSEHFLEKTRAYLNKLLSVGADDNVNTLVMHNVFEPFNPMRAMRYFYSAKSIVVDRDPRDNYVAGLKFLALPAKEFIKRYRLYRDIARSFGPDSKDVLRIQFENLVLDYDEVVPRIINFLEEDPSIHVAPKSCFNPAMSSKNVGIWKTHENQEDIEMIADELKEYLYK